VVDKYKDKMIIDIREFNRISDTDIYLILLQKDITAAVINYKYIIVIDAAAFVTGMVHRSAYLCIFLHRYAGACIRSVAPTRFGLAPHLALAKTSADP
jgi:hypothetical protein